MSSNRQPEWEYTTITIRTATPFGETHRQQGVPFSLASVAIVAIVVTKVSNTAIRVD